MKKHLSIRILALILSFVLLATTLPIAVFANDTSSQSESLSSAEDSLSESGTYRLPAGEGAEPSFPREIPEMRDEFVKHFDNGNGTYEAISYGVAVHRKDENGEWRDIDNTLTLREVKGAERYASSDARVSFAPSLSQSGSIWTLSEKGYVVSLAFSDADLRSGATADVKNHASREEQIAAAKKADDRDALVRVDNHTTVLYPDVLPDVDLEYVLSGNDVKESILVKNVLDQYDFSFRLFLSGLIPKTTEDGEILLLDAKNGEKVYVLPAPYMLDADYEYSDAVAYYLTDLGDGEYRIVVSASSEWINDPERVFPVVIDPTLTSPTGCTADTSVNSNYPDNCYGSSTVMRIGTTHVSFIKSSAMPELTDGATVYDGRVHFAYYLNTTAPGSMVITQHIATKNWSEESTTWNEISQNGTDTSLGLSPAFSSATLTNISGTTQWAEAGITEAAQYWYNGTKYANNFNYGIGLKWNAGPFLNILLHTRNAANGYTPYFSISYFISAGIQDGTYFIKNRQREYYVQIDDDDAPNYSNNGGIMEIFPFGGANYQRWTLTNVGNGYYKITSPVSGYAITVPNGYEGHNNVNLVLTTYTGSDNQKWRIMSTTGSAVKIKAKSSNPYAEDLVMDLETKGTFQSVAGLNVRQREYVQNTSYNDEWYLEIIDYSISASSLIYVNYRMPTITFALNCSTLTSYWSNLFVVSATAWNSAIGSSISFSNASNINCIVNVYPNEDWRGRTTPLTGYYINGELLLAYATIEINALLCTGTTEEIRSTITHEIGHLLGLNDNPPVDDDYSLMNHNRDRSTVYVPTPYDIANVLHRYGLD